MKPHHRAMRALEVITRWGGIDGGHHKQWLLDQVVRVLAPDYDEWVRDYEYEEGSEEWPDKSFEWDRGIPP